MVAYNFLSLVRTAPAAAHGKECLDNISAYYMADEIRGIMRRMMVSISDAWWERAFGRLTARQMAKVMVDLARHVRLEQFRKHPYASVRSKETASQTDEVQGQAARVHSTYIGRLARKANPMAELGCLGSTARVNADDMTASQGWWCSTRVEICVRRLVGRGAMEAWVVCSIEPLLEVAVR